MVHGLMAETLQGWDYQYSVNLAGKKSESVNGELLYRGNKIPMAFERVITPIGEFVFVKELAWASAPPGWVPLTVDKDGVHRRFASAGVESLLSGTNPAFRKSVAGPQTAKPSDAAYIPGKFEQRPKEAGPDWFYAVKPGWWVNPRKIDEALKAIGAE